MGKYTHPPFDEWLENPQALEAGQRAHLAEHLRDCEVCRARQGALESVKRLARQSGYVTPRPNFSQRWQQLWLARQELLRQQRRIGWGLFAMSGSLGLALLMLLAWQVSVVYATPQWLLAFVLFLWTRVSAFGSLLSELASGLSLALIPLVGVGGMLMAGVASILVVLWLMVYQQLTVRRGVA